MQPSAGTVLLDTLHGPTYTLNIVWQISRYGKHHNDEQEKF